MNDAAVAAWRAVKPARRRGDGPRPRAPDGAGERVSLYSVAHLLLVTSSSSSDAEPAGRQSRTNVTKGVETVVARRSAAGDAKVYSAAPPVVQKFELTACDGHGSPALHQRVANHLAAVLRSMLAW